MKVIQKEESKFCKDKKRARKGNLPNLKTVVVVAAAVARQCKRFEKALITRLAAKGCILGPAVPVLGKGYTAVFQLPVMQNLLNTLVP